MKRQYLMMSVSALLMCCLFICPFYKVNADVYPGSASYANKSFILDGASSASQSELVAYLLCTGFYVDTEYIQPYNLNQPSGSSTTWTFILNNARYGREVTALYKLIVRNTTNQDIKINSSYLNLIIDPDSSTEGFHLTDYEWVDGQLIVDRVGTSGAYYFSNAPEYSLNSNIIVPANGDLHCIFKLTYHYDDIDSSVGQITGFTVTWNAPSLPLSYSKISSSSVVVSHDTGFLKWIYDRVNKIFNILNQDQSQTGVDEMEETTETSEEISQTETGYFTGTETALEGTGLSTFTYDTSITTGMSGFLPLFNEFWSDISPITYIPITAMSLKLSTTIIRHLPRKRKE